MRLLAISGSLRDGSHNTALLRAAAELLPDGVELSHYEDLRSIPPFHGDRDDEQAPESVERLRRLVEEADAILIATPEYNASIPGVLKNAIDWLSVPFPDNSLRGKTVAIVGASTGAYGALWAQQDLRRVLGLTGARVVPGELPVAKAHEAFDDGGRLADPLVEQRLRGAVHGLVEAAQPVAV